MFCGGKEKKTKLYEKKESSNMIGRCRKGKNIDKTKRKITETKTKTH